MCAMQLSNESVAGWLHFEDAVVVFFSDFSGIRVQPRYLSSTLRPSIHLQPQHQPPLLTPNEANGLLQDQTREGLIIAIASSK